MLGQEGGEELRLPEWYTLLRAAKYLNVPPWELAEQHVAYYLQAVEAMNAEAQAENELARRREQKAKASKGKRK